MKKPILLVFFLIFYCITVVYGEEPVIKSDQDSLERQILYNGRVWRNLYLRVEGFPFLYSQEFFPGSVTINGKTFGNINLRYDIYKDQILILTDKMIILQLNKEIVDGFTIKYTQETNNFRKLEEYEMSPVSGYVHVIYDGSIKLFVKYKKEIDTIRSEYLNGIFYQVQRIYAMRDGILQQITGRNDFFRFLADKKIQVRNYIKENNIKVSKSDPWSFAAVLAFYDSLN